MSTLHRLQIATPSTAALTPEQKRFNTLLRQIEQARRTLAAWNDNVALYARAHVDVITPLLHKLEAARRDWIFALGRLLDQPGWTKSERNLLRRLVSESAAELLDADGADDAELKALHDKYAEVDFDTGEKQARQAMKELAEAMTGLDLGDDADIASEEDLFRRIQEGMAGQPAAEAQAPPEAPARRRKSAAKQKRESEAQLAAQSIREIFRKLASALHPDRETDPARHAEKTALMQRVNQAYAANDLLTLLELQLQIEQVDASHIASASAQRLKHYNKLLAEQLAELKTEIERVELGFRIDFDLLGSGLNPARLGISIEQKSRQLRAETAAFANDMRLFADRTAARRWLDREKRRMRRAEADDRFF